jgi:flavin reductase (DIM6/NTAB) family NADH-FMN oxidoreductase RutF
MSARTGHLIDATVAPWQEVYRCLTEVVVPRPIALVSTVDSEGRRNLSPFSFFNVVSSNPPYVAFSPQRSWRTGEKKDTLVNVESTGEFVVAVVTEETAEKVNLASASLLRGEGEFEHSGLTAAPSRVVRPSLVAESPVNLECRVVEIRTYGSSPGAGSLVVGEVLVLHVDRCLLGEGGRVLPERLRAVDRMGGDLWVRSRETFAMRRPG